MNWQIKICISVKINLNTHAQNTKTHTHTHTPSALPFTYECIIYIANAIRKSFNSNSNNKMLPNNPHEKVRQTNKQINKQSMNDTWHFYDFINCQRLTLLRKFYWFCMNYNEPMYFIQLFFLSFCVAALWSVWHVREWKSDDSIGENPAKISTCEKSQWNAMCVLAKKGAINQAKLLGKYTLSYPV